MRTMTMKATKTRKDEEENYDKNNHNKDEQNKENPFFDFVLLPTCFWYTYPFRW